MKNQLPLISIIIPTYNSEKYLVECFESVKNQTYKNLEVVIVDGGSDDNTLKIVSSYVSQCGWSLILSNKGVSRQRNVGLKNAKGEYIFFIDSDDYINRDCVNCLYKKSFEDNLDIVTPSIMSVLFDKEEIVKTFLVENKIRKDITKDNFFIDGYKSFLAGPTKLYKREILANNFFDEKVVMGEDYIFNYTLSKNQPFKFGLSENSIYYFRRNIKLSGYEKRLNKNSTIFYRKFLKIVKEQTDKNNKKAATKILKDNTNHILADFVKFNIKIPANMLTTRLYFFLNDHSKKRWFYINPKKYMKKHTDENFFY